MIRKEDATVNKMLSAHFSTDEFRCPHCKQIMLNMQLINKLEELRAVCGRPIKILSGYRCEEHNKAVGGEKASQHCLGNAADISIGTMPLLNFYTRANQVFSDGGVGVYPAGRGQNTDFLHVDVRGKRARWARIEGGVYVGVDEGFNPKGNP